MSLTSISTTRTTDNSSGALNIGSGHGGQGARWSVVVTGQLVGRIWMPAVVCRKDVEARFEIVSGRKETSIRRSLGIGGRSGEALSILDAVEQATADGDFQDARLTADSQIVVTREAWNGRTYTKRARQYDASALPSIAGWVNADEQMQWEGED